MLTGEVLLIQKCVHYGAGIRIVVHFKQVLNNVSSQVLVRSVYHNVLVILYCIHLQRNLDWYDLGIGIYFQYISSNSTYEFLGLKTYHALPLFLSFGRNKTSCFLPVGMSNLLK